MKKIILPVVAIVFAVAGVFATGNNEIDLVTVNVHANTVTGCVKDGTCDQSSGATCTLNSGYVFNVIVSGSPVTCGSPATGVFAL